MTDLKKNTPLDFVSIMYGSNAKGGFTPPRITTAVYNYMGGVNRGRPTTMYNWGGRPPPTYDDDVGGVDRGQSGATTYNWEA